MLSLVSAAYVASFPVSVIRRGLLQGNSSLVLMSPAWLSVWVERAMYLEKAGKFIPCIKLC